VEEQPGGNSNQRKSHDLRRVMPHHVSKLPEILIHTLKPQFPGSKLFPSPRFFFLMELLNYCPGKRDQKKREKPVVQLKQLLFFLKRSIETMGPRQGHGPSTLWQGSV
jgi:hypothetical protein